MSTGEQAIWCEAAMTTLAQCILIPPIGLEEPQEYLQRDLLPHIIHMRKCHEAIRARLAENQKLRRRPWPVLAPQFGRRQAIQAVKFSLVYSQCGLWNEAEALQVVVKDFTCRKLGMEHPASRRISLLLAGTYWQQANTNKAGALQEQVLESCMRALGSDHHETLKVMDTLGASRCFQGRFKEAKEWHEKAIDGMTRTLGPDHEDTLIAVDNLGRVMWRYFRYDEARELHWRAMTGMKRLLGSTHLHTLAAMENLAMAYLQIGGKELLEEAHQLMEEVLEERQKKTWQGTAIHSTSHLQPRSNKERSR
jgi:tetratricopeptide (TPR) repeat protein